MPLSLVFGFQIDWQLSLCPRITVFTIAGTVWKENPDSAVLCLSASQAWPNSHPEHITKSRGFRNRKVEIGSFLLGSQAVACLMLCLEDKSVLEQTMDGSVLGRQMDWLLLILLAPFKDLLGEISHPFSCLTKGWKISWVFIIISDLAPPPALVSVSQFNTCFILPLTVILVLPPPHKGSQRQELVYGGKGYRLWNQIY